MKEISALLLFCLFVGLLLTGLITSIRRAGADEMRTKVILYCIEHPRLCKEEYDNIKTQNKLNNYQKPEIR